METIQNPIIGDKATFISTDQDTGGEKTLLEILLAPKGGNTLHYHKHFTETFTVIEGELKYQLGKQIFTLNPGQSATIPLNAHHRFFSTSDRPTKFLCELRPGAVGLRMHFELLMDLHGMENVPGKACQKIFITLR